MIPKRTRNLRLRKQAENLRRENDAIEAALAAAPKASHAEIIRLALDPAVTRRANGVAASLEAWRLLLEPGEQKAVSAVWDALLREVRHAVVSAEAVARRQS